MSSTYVDGVTPLDAAHMNALQQKVEKAVANGYPSLDATGKIPSAQLPPISSVDYAGAYNAGTTYHAGEFVVGSDGITYQCVKDGTVGISPVPWAPAPSIPYGTGLPASPVDGQETVLVDSITAPTYQWRFRYNAGSSSAYKWEFVGGSPSISYLATGAALTAATVTILTPSLVVPRAGLYQVAATGTFGPGVNTAVGLVGVAVAGTQVGTWGNISLNASSNVTTYSPVTFYTAAASATVAIAVYSSVAVSSYERYLAVTPARVS